MEGPEPYKGRQPSTRWWRLVTAPEGLILLGGMHRAVAFLLVIVLEKVTFLKLQVLTYFCALVQHSLAFLTSQATSGLQTTGW